MRMGLLSGVEPESAASAGDVMFRYEAMYTTPVYEGILLYLLLALKSMMDAAIGVGVVGFRTRHNSARGSNESELPCPQ